MIPTIPVVVSAAERSVETASREVINSRPGTEGDWLRMPVCDDTLNEELAHGPACTLDVLVVLPTQKIPPFRGEAKKRLLLLWVSEMVEKARAAHNVKILSIAWCSSKEPRPGPEDAA